MLKVAYNLYDGHISQGHGSHAEMLRSAREWDDSVRCLIFPEKRAIYFRYPGDGINILDDDACYLAAEKARDAFIKAGLVKKSWRVFHWYTDEKRITSFDVRL